MQAAAGRHALQPALVDRLHENENRAGTHGALRLDQLFAAPELASRDVILHVRYHHRNDRPRLGDAGSFGHHPHLHDLGFDLAKAGGERASACAVGDQDARRPDHGIDDIPRPQQELLDTSIDAGPDEGLVQIDLRFGLGGLGAGLLGR